MAEQGKEGMLPKISDRSDRLAETRKYIWRIM